MTLWKMRGHSILETGLSARWSTRMRSSWLSADLTFKLELAQRESSIYLRMRMIGTMHSENGNWFAKKSVSRILSSCDFIFFLPRTENTWLCGKDDWKALLPKLMKVEKGFFVINYGGVSLTFAFESSGHYCFIV